MTALPVPGKARWQPLRGGLLNLYFFENEVFRFEDGRLLLRGNNGSGKSRVLALQLPFLLDGETRPERMEPDGDPAKRVEWHLLMNGRYPDRSGYSWLEFGRVTDAGAEYRTIGCGMHAVQGKGTPTKWFFVTRQRIGESLELVGTGNAPLTRARLVDAVGTQGQVFESAERYRTAIDQQLFALGLPRYRALVDLLIALRKPQLSRNLEESRLSVALSEALPPVSADILGDVAEALRGLETDRAELDASRAAAEALGRFMVGYKRYIAVAARRRAREVRSSQSAFEAATRECRTSEVDLAAARQSSQETETRLATAKVASAAAEQALRTLEASPEMRNVQALADAEQAAATASSNAERALLDRDRARSDWEDATAKAMAADGEATVRSKEAESALSGLAAKALVAVLPRVATNAPAALIPFDANAIARYRGLVEQELKQRLEHLRTLTGLVKEVAARRDELSRCGSALERARIDRDFARDSRAEAIASRDRISSDTMTAYASWCFGLVELAPASADTLEGALAEWIVSAPGNDSPLRRAIETSVRTAIETLAGRRPQLLREMDARQTELAELEASRQQLLAGEHRSPPARYTLRGTRDARVGAPLWAVCDFGEEVNPMARAGYEAALEASGLLDAWVGIGGLIVSQPDGDLYLSAGEGGPVANPLTQVLRVAIDRDDPCASALDEATVQQILSRIGTAPAAGETWVDSSGRFSVGMLQGAWTKDYAEFIGHGAREEARRARLRLVEEQLVAAREAVTAATALVDAHDERRRVVDREHANAPSDEALRDAVDNVVHAEKALTRANAAVQSAETALDEARQQHDHARKILADAAEAIGLLDRVEDLDSVRESAQQLELEAARVWGVVELLRSAIAHATSAHEILDRGKERLARAMGTLEAAATEHARANAHVATLKETVGATDILDRVAAARRTKAATKTEEDAAHGQQVEVERLVSRLEERVLANRATLTERTATRDVSVESLVALAQTKLLEAIGEAGDGDERPSTTAMVEMARRLENTLSSTAAETADWERVQRDLNTRFGDLDTTLAVHGHRPALIDQAGLRVVRIPFRGTEIDANGLSQVLNDDVASRERILAAREREIIESHLLGEISTHLHHQLRRAEELVMEMNQEIESRPMSTGMRLKFQWSPHPEAPPGFDKVRGRLLATQATWSTEERNLIADFLQERIRDVRSREEAGTWQEHLAQAFDYRKWHRFGISRFQDGRWQPLTRRTHGTGSGGEKAIALTLPQLAAAAAHYRSAAPEAPRLILLDEAFVGVDNDMRSKCFDLLQAFDLDFVMTSEREWGCYPTVPALAIYQLTTRPGIDAVHTTRLVWNGRQRTRDDQDLRS